MSANLPTSRPQRLGVDIDGVLADFTYPVAALASQMFGLQVSGYATHWNWMRDYGVVDERERELWAYLTSHPEWWQSLPTLPGAADALDRLCALHESGLADVYFITTRPGPGVKLATETWLREHGFDRATVCIAGDKGPIAAGLKLDFFIDDRPENCYSVAGMGASSRPHDVQRIFIPERPWNTAPTFRQGCETLGIIYCDGLGDALTLAGIPQ